MSTQVHANLTEEQVQKISSDLDEPQWMLQQRLEALEALEDLEMPKVIRTPGRDWTNLDALEFDRFVDPLDRAQEKDRVDARRSTSTATWSRSSSAVSSTHSVTT
jgi:Fe-S cluster assembly protein SufD